MKKEEILEKLTDIYSQILDHKNFELQDETTANDVDGWDSITHMMIISETEKMFNIKFKLMDLMKMDNVGDLISTIQTEIK